MGVDGARDRLKVFVFAAVLAGVGGWLYAHLQRTVSPTPFSANASIEYLFMAVVGGLGSVWGAIVGASLILVTKDILQRVTPYFTNQTGTYELIVFGGLLVLLLQSSVGGVWSFLARLRSRAAHHAAVRISHLATGEMLAHRQRPERGSEVLRVESVSKKFAGLTAVDNVSFSVGAGEILGLIGPNGAGKSTMFNIISGTLMASGGRVLLQGEDVTRLPGREIAARRLSRSFQHVKIHPDMSVLENVALGAHLRGGLGHLRSMIRMNRREETSLLTEARVHLRRLGLGDVEDQPAGALALGQQRTLEIARSLAADPVLLLLDEPAAGLRYNEKQKLAVLLKELSLAGLAIVLVEHDMEFVMGLSDRIVVMEFGRKLTEGGALEVQKNPAVIEAYLGAAE
jgi:branched-chain amino acid transport system permease protein